jgi:probable rRNA maturation factor
MITLSFARSIRSPHLKTIKEKLKLAAQPALEYTGTRSNADLSILVTTSRRIQRLNRKYLDIDSPTDVLAFPAGEINPESGGLYLGDVIISYPEALTQANAENQPVETELQLLVIHGVLHLSGFDHADEDSKASMWAAQQTILDRLA